MSYLRYNGKMVTSNNKYVTGILGAPEGVLDFNNTYYVTLSANPDLSGTKTVRWKMWMDSSAGANGYLFSIGSNQNAMQIYTSGTDLRCGNVNRIMSTQGEKYISRANLAGYVLECIAVKTINEILWFQVGGYSSGDQNLGSSGSAPTTSRFGADGLSSPGSGCAGMYVWDIRVESSVGGTSLHNWSGYGTAPNVDSAWLDTVGSENGTVAGSPGIKTLTPSGTLFTDWFLPSKDELAAMRTNLYLAGFGNFNGTQAYWTSSEFSTTDAWAQLFSSGTQTNVTKAFNGYARAARRFTAAPSAYNLTDLGPAGGRIFYIDGGTTYYEAAPVDNLYGTSGGSYKGNVWSNITTFGIGPATGTAIGTGITNTPLIVASGCIYSAAGVCDALTVKI